MSIFASVIIDEINGANKITKRLYKYGLYCVTELCRREERKKCRYIHKERLCDIGGIHHPHDLWHIDEKTPQIPFHPNQPDKAMGARPSWLVTINVAGHQRSSMEADAAIASYGLSEAAAVSALLADSDLSLFFGFRKQSLGLCIVFRL
jgi:hypothetical protein